VRYATGGDFRRALERRLLTSSLQEHVPLARLRKFVAFDRLLARLLDAAPDAWVLKGGLALQLRLGQRARTTKDMESHMVAVDRRPAPGTGGGRRARCWRLVSVHRRRS
jgi:hypothetical protein